MATLTMRDPLTLNNSSRLFSLGWQTYKPRPLVVPPFDTDPDPVDHLSMRDEMDSSLGLLSPDLLEGNSHEHTFGSMEGMEACLPWSN